VGPGVAADAVHEYRRHRQSHRSVDFVPAQQGEHLVVGTAPGTPRQAADQVGDQEPAVRHSSAVPGHCDQLSRKRSRTPSNPGTTCR
jgi:hypothetical protein